MPVERLDTSTASWVDDPRLADFRNVRDPELVRRGKRFLAEGRLVLRTLLRESPLRAHALLLEEPALAWVEGEGIALADNLPVYVVPGGAMRDLSGFCFHQGCLASGIRPESIVPTTLLEQLDRDAGLVVGLDGLSNPDNVGAIFRTAAALGASAIFLSPDCASPLYRKAIRTSMGAALRLPFSHGHPWKETLEALGAAGYERLALTPAEDAEDLRAFRSPAGRSTRRALLLGAEGPGLGALSLASADARVRIPMDMGIDSLNVAAATAVALYTLRSENG